MKRKHVWLWTILWTFCVCTWLSGCAASNVTDTVSGWVQGENAPDKGSTETEASGTETSETGASETEASGQDELDASLAADPEQVDDNPFRDFEPSAYNTDTPGEGIEIFVDRAIGPYLLLRCENHGNVSYESVGFTLFLQSDYADYYPDGVSQHVSSFSCVPPYGTVYFLYGPDYVEAVVDKGGDKGDRILYEDYSLEDVVSFQLGDCVVSEELYVDVRPYVHIYQDIDAGKNRWGYLDDSVIRGAGLFLGRARISVIVDGSEVVRLQRGDKRENGKTPLEPGELQFPLARNGMSFAEWENVQDQYNFLDLNQPHTYELIAEFFKCEWT